MPSYVDIAKPCLTFYKISFARVFLHDFSHDTRNPHPCDLARLFGDLKLRERSTKMSAERLYFSLSLSRSLHSYTRRPLCPLHKYVYNIDNVRRWWFYNFIARRCDILSSFFYFCPCASTAFFFSACCARDFVPHLRKETEIYSRLLPSDIQLYQRRGLKSYAASFRTCYASENEATTCYRISELLSWK